MKWSTVYVDADHVDVVRRGVLVTVPIDDVSGPLKHGQIVRMHIFDADNRPGYGQECLAIALGGDAGDEVRISPSWHTLGPEPEWDTSTQYDGTRNHLTFGWRWQYHPARTMNLPWWKWAWNGGTDEFCNKAWWFRLPWASIAVFYKRPYRTKEDGRCGECRREA